MSWNANTHRISGKVHIADVKDATGYNSLSIRDQALYATINKWAKFKPVRSSAPAIKTVDGRRTAGRATSNDYTRQFGVHASGAGNAVDLADIHLCTFDYERPVAGRGYKYRLLDFRNPENSSYGYRSDAHCDLQGTVYPATGTVTIPTGQVGMLLEVAYTPHSAADAQEMLSIADFLEGNNITVDPADCYPCAIITQGSYHYIRGLYPQGGSAVAKIGDTITGMWQLDCTNAPAWTAGSPATISLFLASQKILLHGSPNLSIENWITIPTVDGASAWEARMVPVPDATGRTATIGAQPSLLVELTGASISGKTLTVTWSVTGTGIRNNYTLRVAMGGDEPEKAMTIRPQTTTGSTDFDLDTDFPSTPFIPGTPQTEDYQASILNGNLTPAAVVDTETYRLTYQG